MATTIWWRSKRTRESCIVKSRGSFAIAALGQTAATPVECQHGCQEQRFVRVYSANGIDTQRWLGAKTVLCVERRRCTADKCSIHQAYYLSSVATTAAVWNTLVRGHWSIENRLHWPKDVVLHEDETYGRDPNALLNTSLFRSITINVLRLNGFNAVKLYNLYV